MFLLLHTLADNYGFSTHCAAHLLITLRCFQAAFFTGSFFPASLELAKTAAATKMQKQKVQIQT
jgi:hypothetical protein